MEEKKVKSGWKTTEFWVTFVTTASMLLNQSGILGDVALPVETLGALAASVAAYVISRGMAKK